MEKKNKKIKQKQTNLTKKKKKPDQSNDTLQKRGNILDKEAFTYVGENKLDIKENKNEYKLIFD